MEPLNQYFISRVLGSTMKKTKRPAFGPMGLLHARNQVLAQRPRTGEQMSFEPPAEKKIIRAFEDIRQGLPVDRVFADPDLAASFFKRCRQFEIIAPDSALALRILTLRKSAKIKRATAPREPKRDYSPYLFAAEMASIQVKYRFGASVDDILAYPAIGQEFDRLASQLQPGWKPIDYRLAALHIRKSRYCKPEDRDLFGSISAATAETKAEELGPLSMVDINKAEKMDGIVGLVEKTAYASRFLYIVQAENMPALRPFTKKATFDALANTFWSPSLSTIFLVVYGIHDHYRNAPQSLWALRLIHEKSPVFNWPVRFNSAA